MALPREKSLLDELAASKYLGAARIPKREAPGQDVSLSPFQILPTAVAVWALRENSLSSSCSSSLAWECASLGCDQERGLLSRCGRGMLCSPLSTHSAEEPLSMSNKTPVWRDGWSKNASNDEKWSPTLTAYALQKMAELCWSPGSGGWKSLYPVFPIG